MSLITEGVVLVLVHRWFMSIDQCQQFVDGHRLDQVMVETDLLGAFLVVCFVVARGGDEGGLLPLRGRADFLDQGVTVHAGQTDVADDQVIRPRRGAGQRGDTVEALGDVMVRQRQQLAQGFIGIKIIFHQQDAQPPAARRDGRCAGRGHCVSQGQRQQHREFAAPSQAFAGHGDRSAMQLDDGAGQRQADAEPALGTIGRSQALREQLENKGLLRGLTPMPWSRTTTHTLRASVDTWMSMLSFSGENLAALLSRLENTWANRTGSPDSSTGCCGKSILKRWWRASMSGRLASTAASMMSDSDNSDFFTVMLPLLMREASNRSSTSRARWATWRPMMRWNLSTSGPPTASLPSSSLAIAIGCSGLRSSWASINRNSVCRRLAASAFACKSCAPMAACNRLWLASRSCSSCVSLCSIEVFLRCRNSTCSSSSAITARNSSTSRRCRAWMSCPGCSAACAGVSEKSCSFWSTMIGFATHRRPVFNILRRAAGKAWRDRQHRWRQSCHHTTYWPVWGINLSAAPVRRSVAARRTGQPRVAGRRMPPPPRPG